MSKKKKQGKQEPDKEKQHVRKGLTAQAPRKLILTASFILAAIAFLLYSNTLNHHYVLDDFSVIKDNTVTKKGTDAIGEILTHTYRHGAGTDDGGIYRPLSKVMFAIEWEISPDDPSLSHWVNVIMYALSAYLLFITLLRWMKVNIVIPFVITLLYAAHPIHTEVVANIKSRDEILSLIFILLSLLTLHRYIQKQKTIDLLLACASYFLALMSKESSITYLGLVPVTIWFFTSVPLRKNLVLSLTMLAVTGVYLIIHRMVVGTVGIDNVPVVDNSLYAAENFGEQRATAILIMGHYLKLLLFPHPLSCDYSYNTIPIIKSMGDPMFLLAFVIHAALGVYAIIKWKNKDFIAWCILFYFITMALASNIFYLIGTNMAERLLFVPSLAFAAATGYLLSKLFKTNTAASYGNFSGMLKSNGALIGVVAVITLLYGFKTMDRNADWKTVKYLFEQDIKTVPNSAHMLFYHANMNTNSDSLKVLSPPVREATLKAALGELNRALQIWEQFPDAHNQVGKIYFELKNYEMAAKAYERALSLNHKNSTYYNNYGTCLFSTGKYMESEKYFIKALELNKEYDDALCNLGSVYGTMGEISRAQGKPAEAKAWFEKSLPWFKKTLEVNPKYENAYKFLVATYNSLGMPQDAAYYDAKLKELNTAKQNANKPQK